jgi:hypothetical protein
MINKNTRGMPLRKLMNVVQGSDGPVILPNKSRYDPVDNTSQYTSICINQYARTEGGIIQRTLDESKLIGYCTNSPKETLEYLFPNFHITEYKGLELFGYDDFEKQTPMVGLSINGIDKLFGINGRVEDFPNNIDVTTALRNEEITDSEVSRIINNQLSFLKRGCVIKRRERNIMYSNFKELYDVIRKCCVEDNRVIIQL